MNGACKPSPFFPSPGGFDRSKTRFFTSDELRVTEKRHLSRVVSGSSFARSQSRRKLTRLRVVHRGNPRSDAVEAKARTGSIHSATGAINSAAFQSRVPFCTFARYRARVSSFNTRIALRNSLVIILRTCSNRATDILCCWRPIIE